MDHFGYDSVIMPKQESDIYSRSVCSVSRRDYQKDCSVADVTIKTQILASLQDITYWQKSIPVQPTYSVETKNFHISRKYCTFH